MPGGVYVANVTPFGSDADYTLDVEAYISHVSWLASVGVDGIVPFGTNGEGPLMSLNEKLELLGRLCVDFSGLNIILTVTEQSLPEARRAVRELNELPLQAILVLPPYYYKPASSEGLARFFESVVEVSRHPVLAYNIPKYAVPVEADTVRALPVWGVKDSSGEDSYSEEVIKFGKGVLAGTEQNLWESLQRGVDGAISALANFAPEMVIELFAAFEARDTERGLEVSRRLQHVRTETKRYPTPAVLKALAARRHGADMGTVRPPLAPLSADQKLEEVLDAASQRTDSARR